MTLGQRASEHYSVELVSKEPKWHFIRVVLSLLGVPYARPKPFAATDLRSGEATPRFRLLIRDNASARTLSEQKLSGASVANEAMQNVEKDLEDLSVAEFRDKYGIGKR